MLISLGLFGLLAVFVLFIYWPFNKYFSDEFVIDFFPRFISWFFPTFFVVFIISSKVFTEGFIDHKCERTEEKD